MIGELEKMVNLDIPKDLSSDEANKYLVDACAKFDIKCPPPQTTARLLDKVDSVSMHGNILEIVPQLSIVIFKSSISAKLHISLLVTFNILLYYAMVLVFFLPHSVQASLVCGCFLGFIVYE